MKKIWENIYVQLLIIGMQKESQRDGSNSVKEYILLYTELFDNGSFLALLVVFLQHFIVRITYIDSEIGT